MIVKGFLFILLILLSAAFMMVSFIISLVKYSANKKGAGQWLIGFFIAIMVLLSSIFLLTRGVINKTNEFKENIAKMSIDQIGILDPQGGLYQLNEDSILQSAQVSKLIAMEPLEFVNHVPTQFYTYLGFRDYYRLPLRYPYSLHCIDSLGNAELYNEQNVTQFDVNDNGELFCDLSKINSFCFNRNFLIGTRIKSQGEKASTMYFIYDFASKEMREFKTEKGLRNYAKSKGFKEGFVMNSCKGYYRSF